MWLFLWLFLQVPPERVELKVLNEGIKPVPSNPPLLTVPDTIKWPEPSENTPTIPFKVGKAPEMKRIEIPFNEVLYQSIAQNTISEYRERVKNAVKSKADDREIARLKMEMEKTLLMQRLEISKIEGKDEEVEKVNRALTNLENLMKTLEVEK